MLGDFGKNVGGLFKRILSRTTVDAEAVEALIKGLQKELIKTDVDLKLIMELSKNIRTRCLKEKIPAGMTLREHVAKVIYDELVSLLGQEKASLLGKKRIMLVGLFGSGKTTTCGKLAKYFQKQGLKPALIACDYHRPGAPQQLKQLGQKLNAPVHVSEEKDPYKALKDGIGKFNKYDTIIIDTAGRDALDKQLAKELKKMYEIAKPDEVLLVLPADIGRVGGKQAEEFSKLVGITGVIITKMDGTAKGGGSLSACNVTGGKVKFIGVGEKLGDLQQYDPVRFVSRLLGMGDLQTLLEKAKEADFSEKKAEKIMSGKFTLQDFYEQIEAMQNMGSLDNVMEMIPGMKSAIPKDLLGIQEEKMKKYKYMIDSMTRDERENPETLHASRIQRIAKGSGTNKSEVKELVKQYETTKKMLKKMGGKSGLKRGAMGRLMKKFGMKF